MSLKTTQRREHYRILAVSDKVEPRIYGPNIRNVAKDADLILGCGDLPYYYLEYIVSALNLPLYYVHGNHDRSEHRANDTVVDEPPGGENLHHQVCHVDGLIIAGLEGSHRYNNNPRYQYTQNDMWRQVLSLAPVLLSNYLRYGRYLDVFIAHSPAFGIHDASDRPHTGFHAFLSFLRWFKPRYFLHGHQHVYRSSVTTRTRYEQTEIINVYPFKVLDLKFDPEG